MKPAALTIEALEYGRENALFSPLSFTCQPGELWAVLGANGLGKSTLLDTLTGVLPALSGRFTVLGGIGIVPQSFRPAFAWSVHDVVLMGRARHVGLFSMPSAEDEKQVEKALAQLNIHHLSRTPFLHLSGGQQQLVMIARALVSGNRTILLDEPCSALDLSNQQTVLQLIEALAHEEERSVLFTTHDPTHALQVAHHTLLLLPNQHWLAGETQTVLSEENLQRAYGLPVRRIQLDEARAPALVPLFNLRRQKTGVT
ncbi:ABC transporter ATP-binding protein [Kosakonia sacchari]|uniref:ABC transporter ATP-binding protein n=1 Tax=Kosakonia sacchari TaxID=1158459 RepID=UPI001585A9DC|nr:ABC transporter ATP-binding protein [Kosakonia sacchari]NUL38970.1 ABC transporter ATP-binding protein [Kosakonia sacchari]